MSRRKEGSEHLLGTERNQSALELLNMLGLPRSLTVDGPEGEVPAMAEQAGRERPVRQRQAAPVEETACAVYDQLSGTFDHAVRLRPNRCAREISGHALHEKG